MAKTKLVGVSYAIGDVAPVVMLKAAGSAAEEACRQASASGSVPIVRDAALVEQLYRVPLDAPVGRELFPAMALLLSHVLRIDRQHREER